MLFSTAGTAGKARLTIAPDGPPGEGSGLQEHIRGETGGRRGPAGRHRAASGGPRRGSGRGRRQGEPEWQAVSPTACRSGPPGPGLPMKKERLVLQQTSNYQLSQWDAEDRIQRTDFNSDNAKVDAALHETATAVTKCGNCQIGILQYTGTGGYGSATPTRITFPRKPAAFLVTGSNAMMVAVCEQNSALVANYNSLANVTSFVTLDLAWANNEAAFYSSNSTRQMNDSGVNFLVIAFYAMDSE